MNGMRKTVVVLLAVLALSCVVSAGEAVTAEAPEGAGSSSGSSKDSTLVVAGLNALPSAPSVLPVSGAASGLAGKDSAGVPDKPVAGGLWSPGMMVPVIAPATAPAPSLSPELPGKHPFLDKANLAIFASVAAGRTMDLVSTWQFRRHGLHEGELSDAFVDNKPLFATYSASLVAGQISTSYIFHRLGWHKLERATAIIHTAVVTEAVIHNYRIGTRH
jgi:hypothetical protein